jgi:hypothetical protein
MDINKIILKSAYIAERRRGAAYEAAASDRSAERLQEWKRLLNVSNNESIYSKRLQFDGISEEEAFDICGDSVPLKNPKQPQWAAIIEDVMKLLPQTCEEADSLTALRRKDIKLTGPVLSLFPFVAYCENRWKEFAEGLGGLSQLPMKDFSGMLLNRLYQTTCQAFNTRARFMTFMGHKKENVWEEMEKELLSGGWRELYEEYPVLARRMGTVIEHYLTFIQEFYRQFSDKKEILQKEFFGGESIGPVKKLEGENDLGYVGDIVSINTTPIINALENGYIPVIATVGMDDNGQIYNINADTAAAEIAAALKAENMLMLTDIRGLLRDVKDDASLIPSVTLSEVDALIAEGIIAGGMIPKVKSCRDAVSRGVVKAFMIDGRIPHSILLEMFSDEGIGTMFTA